ncbi:SusC/RagA family TonB-linked outer membrane protein [Mangrovibacterium diazotrophicum]|uniref:TonB-linked SusC/RagA family outer membrane protein n=1 Tax=Mangrovibacterium diazotrophicum TaxID=1261403 RepID=A0A419VYH4_9BACT|nr:TonB-dependent receptor [Mangrovibacterium diazotrophicum]RKD88262.1 TonB-linked SusC/RagA family outer membrane protein [Mangrovibacterium diazotrophicum]
MKTVIIRACFLLALFVLPFVAGAQELVSGKVTDGSGEPLIGATVVRKGTTQGTVTDAFGAFKLKLAPGDVLICSFIGYQPLEVTYKNEQPLIIKLSEDNQKIDDVVVVGYGTQIKREVTGSVSSVKMDEMTETQASESFESMLQGKIAGVNIQINSGEPGATPTVIIRGLAAVSRDDGSAVSDPLYVVDGVPIISRTSDDFAITSTNVLADLDPNDIEDIVVLKDASAAAIYGSRAANGVILVTTKKGKRGRPQINFNMRYGINFVPQLQDVAGGVKEREQVARLYELYAPYGIYMPSMYTDVTNPFYNNSSDWQGYLYNTSITQDYNGSVRGAGDFGQYSVSMGYMDSKGILFNTGFKRYNLMTNTSFNALNKALVVNNTLAVSRTDQSKNPDALSTSYSSLLPLPDDPIVEGTDVYGVGSDSNLNDRIRFSSDATLNFLKSMAYNVSVSLEYTRAMRDYYSESRRTLYASNSSDVGESKNVLLQNTLTYTPMLGENHNLQVLLGQSAEKTESSVTSVSSVSDAPSLSETVDWPTDNNIGTSDYTASTILSYFSRVNYSFKQKYMVGASIRADGSSKFGKANRWGIFPSVSGGWNFSSEKLFSGLDWLTSGKLRVSYGISGTTWNNDYLALGVMDGGSLDIYNSLLEVSYGGVGGYTPTWYDGFKNEDLTWVKSEMTNVGLDLSLFDSKVEFIFDAYEKLTKGLLLTTSLPTTSGYNEVYRNAADVLNRGLEFTLNTNLKLSGNLHWSMGLNFAYNKNRVVALPDGNADIIKTSTSGTDFGSIIRVGNPLNGFFFYESEGIYQTENEIPVDPKTGASLVGLQDKVLAVGDRKFKDQNNDYQIDVDDRIYAGDPNPKWTGGWTNDFSYKGFSLSVVSTFVIGRDIVNTELLDRLSLDKDFAGSTSLPNFDNYSIWEKSGDNAKYPTLNPWSDVNQIITQDSEYIEDGSYFKIKTATLSYNFNKGLLKHLPFQSARVYCTLDNVVTFQKYSGPDAELITVDGFDDSDGYPMRRMLLFGVSLGL